MRQGATPVFRCETTHYAVHILTGVIHHGSDEVVPKAKANADVCPLTSAGGAAEQKILVGSEYCSWSYGIEANAIFDHTMAFLPGHSSTGDATEQAHFASVRGQNRVHGQRALNDPPHADRGTRRLRVSWRAS